ncbi:MAG TPA: hypothetical protein VK283_10600 [Acidimicrobiales bacterium]|nr:hypothetical protein [Acidimicrobiales bacterium]
MAFSYDHDKQILELQATNGRLSVKSAVRQVTELMEAEVDRLEKMADVLGYQPGMSTAYRAKAKEVRDSIPAEVNRLVVKATARPDLSKVVSTRYRGVEDRLDMLEKSIAADPTRRPIGMPAPATAVPATPPISRGPDNGPTWPSKPTSEMSNLEKAVYYGRLFRQAPTPADARMWSDLAAEYAEAARKEERN